MPTKYFFVLRLVKEGNAAYFGLDKKGKPEIIDKVEFAKRFTIYSQAEKYLFENNLHAGLFVFDIWKASEIEITKTQIGVQRP